jgi:putrescine aminotransferase
MSDPEKAGINRNQFLKLSGAAAGGMVGSLGIVGAPEAAAAPRRRRVAPIADIERDHRARLGSPQVDVLEMAGLKLVYGERQGGRVRDAHSGRWYWDCHRLGSTYNVGHRHPRVLAALRSAVDQLDLGNFMVLSGERTRTAAKLATTTNDSLPCTVFTVSGAEANEVAMKAARVFTGRRRFVCFDGGYHGDTMMTLAVGGDDQKIAAYALRSTDIIRIPFNDLAAARAVIDSTVAAVIGEPTVAQLGFPEPIDGYWAGIAELCASVGALTILDEVQTGGGATGTFWHYQQLGFTPDILVSGKWPSGGYFPNSFALMRADVHEAQTRGVFMPHPSTFGGSDIGSVVTSTVIDVLVEPVLLARVRALSARFAAGFAGATFTVNRNGMCMALIDTRRSNFASVRLLAEQGVITVPALHHPHAVEFRPVLTIGDDEADAIIAAVLRALA